MSVLPLPALGLFILATAPAVLLERRLWVRAVPLVLLALSVNLFLPIRAEQDPVINEGDPTCETLGGAALAIYTHGKLGCPMLADNLTRRQYQPPPVTQRKAPFSAQVEMWWQYFEWQWARGLDPSELPFGPRLPLGLLFLGLGIVGLWVAWSSDRVLFAYLLVLAATLTVALVYYLNFRYGYSLAPHIADPAQHEVRERGRVPEALQHYDRALAIHRAMGSQRMVGLTLGNLAAVHAGQGRIDQAAALFHEALTIARQCGDRRSEGTFLATVRV